MEEKILTLQEAARLLKISDATLRNWIKKGKIPAFREGRAFRVRREDLDKRFKKQRQT
jgi:putative molybdopterin biosynthesis protein